jgi:hypothetical protein
MQGMASLVPTSVHCDDRRIRDPFADIAAEFIREFDDRSAERLLGSIKIPFFQDCQIAKGDYLANLVETTTIDNRGESNLVRVVDLGQRSTQ